MRPAMPFFLVALVSVAVASPCRAGNAVHRASPATASRHTEQAFYRRNTASLTAIATDLESGRGQAGPAAKYTDYYLGYAYYALARLEVGEDGRKADRYVDDAEKALLRAVHADDDFVEAHALLASAYGLEIGLHPFHGMWLGRRIGEHMDRARELAPRNPRVILARAISDYHKPSRFGGNMPRAVQEFGEAIAAFRHFTPANPLAPTWGEAQAYALRAQAQAKTGDVAEALRDYHAALKLAPDYEEARTGLANLPEGPTAPSNH